MDKQEFEDARYEIFVKERRISALMTEATRLGHEVTKEKNELYGKLLGVNIGDYIEWEEYRGYTNTKHTIRGKVYKMQPLNDHVIILCWQVNKNLQDNSGRRVYCSGKPGAFKVIKRADETD